MSHDAALYGFRRKIFTIHIFFSIHAFARRMYTFICTARYSSSPHLVPMLSALSDVRLQCVIGKQDNRVWGGVLHIIFLVRRIGSKL